MTINQTFTRIDTLRIKESILKVVGGTRYEIYSTLLRRFFSAGLSADEFHKLCIQTIGGENLHVHNELIKGILQNAYSVGVPLAKKNLVPLDDASSDEVGSKKGCKPKVVSLHDTSLLGSSDNVKPKRGRKRKDPPLNDSSLTSAKVPAACKRKDQPSEDSSLASTKTPEGLRRKYQPSDDSSLVSAKTPRRLEHNGQPLNDASLTNAKTPAGHKRKDPPLNGMSLPSSFDVKASDGCQGNLPPAILCCAPSPRKARTTFNRPSRFKKCTSPLLPVTKPEPVSSVKSVPITPDTCISIRPAVESSEDAEQIAVTPGVLSVSPPPITAPFGISNNFFGSSKAKALCNTFVCDCKTETCCVKGELPNTISLKNRLDRMLRMEGMNITLDGANLLNRALDFYLKRLIKPIIDLSGTSSAASLLDFNTAMALQPQVLGELPERISRPYGYKKLAHYL